VNETANPRRCELATITQQNTWYMVKFHI